MKKRTLNYAFALLSLLVFFKKTASAQPAPLKAMIPPSPNAAALGEYGKVPVGLFTGTVQQSIPLYTISVGDYTMPISLDYRSNGLKVLDAGSNVGLGWVLNAGGVISRTLNDERDEYISTKSNLPAVAFDTQQMTDFLKIATSDNQLDGEPDIFSFNFGNYAGRFYLSGTSPNMQAVLISPSPLKIEFLPNFYSDDINSVQIKITAPDGIIYWFGGTNAIEQSSSRTYGAAGENLPTAKIRTAWHLTKVTLLNQDEINFVYAYQGLTYDAGISQTIPTKLTYKSSTGFYVEYASHKTPMITKVTGIAAKLTEINWKNGQVSFTYSSRFSGPSTMEKIDNLLISTKNYTELTPLKKYTFNYLVTDALTTYNNPDNLNGTQVDASKHLFLSALISQSPDDAELNKYTFDYYSADSLPNRFSYCQDYWGYFNGQQANRDLVTNDVSSYNPAYYQVSGSFPQAAIIDLFKYVGGNKKPYGEYAVKGMLKKITYPTGGYSILEYEPHSIGQIESVPPPTKQNVYLYKGGPITYTTGIIPFDQDHVPITPGIWGDPNTCPNSGGTGGLQHVNYKLTITEVQSNTTVPLEEYINYIYTPVPTPKTMLYNDLYVNTPKKTYFFSFKQGKSYTISVQVSSTCTDYNWDFSCAYYAQNATQQWVNRNIGGIRLSKITTGDLTGNEQIKRYYYGSDLNCPTCSSGKIRMVEPAISYYETLELEAVGAEQQEVATLTANLMSSPLHDLSDNQGYHITYSTVIEGMGNNFEGGAIIHNFNSIPEIPSFAYRDPVVGAPFTNVFGNGEELKTTYYKNNNGSFVKVKETANSYVNDNRIVTSASGFRATKRSFSYKNSAETYNLNTYSINSQWRYLTSSAETTYDQNGSNGSIVTTTYVYNNPLHMQVSSVLGTTSQGNRTYHNFTYPQDYAYSGTLTGNASVMKEMVNRNMLSSIIEEITQKEKVTKFEVIYYTNSGTITTYKLNNNQVVKDANYRLKLTSPAADNSVDYIHSKIANGLFTYDSHYELDNQFVLYDVNQNLVQLKQRDNYYSFRCPVNGEIWAKTTHATYNETAYSGFEHAPIPTDFTNWSYDNTHIIASSVYAPIGSMFGGVRAYRFSGAADKIVNRIALDNTQKFKISFWGKGAAITVTANPTSAFVPTAVNVPLRTGPTRLGWTYYEGYFTNAVIIQLQGTGIIDELRLYPQGARMTTYVYKNGTGIIMSECNENNQNSFWDYDEFNRLRIGYDQDGFILNKNEYNYQQTQ